jgi:hypothetical protein
VRLFFLENAEHTARRGMAFRARAHSRAADQNPVAIHVHRLLRNADKDHEGPLGRNFRMPPVLAGFERSGRLTSRCAFGVKRRLLHRMRGGEECDDDSKNT